MSRHAWTRIHMICNGAISNVFMGKSVRLPGRVRGLYVRLEQRLGDRHVMINRNVWRDNVRLEQGLGQFMQM